MKPVCLRLGLLLSAVLVSLVCADEAKVLIKPQYREGMVLSYRWDLAGRSAWNPPQDDVDWLEGTTRFEFDLQGKTLRDDGSLTFEIQGKHLAAEGQSNKGKLGVEATPDKARLRVNHEWTKWHEHTPLRHEMTVTLGNRFEPRLSTGLAAMIPYFLPQVDWRFWTMATSAPKDAVKVGDSWEQEFQWPVPWASRIPLNVKARWTVLAAKMYKGQRVIPIRLEARLTTSDAPWVLDNGDRVQIRSAVYEARGTAYWHEERGILCYADVAEQLTAYAQPPDTRRLEHQATSKLELLGAR